ncbi:MAG: hypothetical protein IJV00_04680, partial [Clostridia bacterium]|nr:hypothetical protein [Clostridia bacterium]
LGTYPDVTPEGIDSALEALKSISDLVILDMPAGGGEFFSVLASSPFVDMVAVITTDAPTSVRCAERCGMEIAKLANKPVKLLINCYDVRKPKNNGAGLVDLVGSVAVPALGVIPLDPAVPFSLSEGRPVTSIGKTDAARAVNNVYARLFGKNVPLLDGIVGSRKKNKLF